MSKNSSFDCVYSDHRFDFDSCTSVYFKFFQLLHLRPGDSFNFFHFNLKDSSSFSVLHLHPPALCLFLSATLRQFLFVLPFNFLLILSFSLPPLHLILNSFTLQFALLFRPPHPPPPSLLLHTKFVFLHISLVLLNTFLLLFLFPLLLNSSSSSPS